MLIRDCKGKIQERLDEQLPSVLELLNIEAEDKEDIVDSQIFEIAKTYSFLQQAKKTRISDIRHEAIELKELSDQLIKKLAGMSVLTARVLCYQIKPPFKINPFIDTLNRFSDALTKQIEKLGPPSSSDSRVITPDNLKYNLVSQCYEVFEEYRPGDARSTHEGPFAEFARCVYEIATGEIAELESTIKKVIRDRKKIRIS